MATFSVETIQPQQTAAIRAEVPRAELRSVFDRGFRDVVRAVEAQGGSITGPPFGFYPRMPADTVSVVVGFPVRGPITADGEVEPFGLPGGRVVTGVHVGPYETLTQTYEQLIAWTKIEGVTLADGTWESYLSDPSAEPDPSQWRTRIACLLA